MSRRMISRHRLPQPYRAALAILWVVPLALLILTIWIGRGFTLAVLDPRLLLPALIMLIPAAYVWREGIDVLPDGIIRRAHIPRYYTFDQLETWYFDRRNGRRVITIWDHRGRKLVEVYGVLTNLPALLQTLHDQVRWRGFPY